MKLYLVEKMKCPLQNWLKLSESGVTNNERDDKTAQVFRPLTIFFVIVVNSFDVKVKFGPFHVGSAI